MPEKTNVYQIVTDRIIAELEKGVIPWSQPWTGKRSGAYSRATGKPYSLLNQMMMLPPEDLKPADPIAEAEELATEYLEREGITLVHHDLNHAFYSPIADKINMPLLEQFTCPNKYYSTLYHEMIHSTGATKRLKRIKTDALAAFCPEDYSKEELVAEIGSATIMNMMGLELPETFRNSVAFLQSWIKALKSDSRMIVSAASQAQKAIEYITGEKEK